MRIFISGHRQDEQAIKLVKQALKSVGISPLSIDLYRSLGNDIFDRLDDVLPNIDYVLAILSKAYVNNDWLKKELIAFFLKENNAKTKIIIPVIVETCKVPDILEDGRIKFDLRKPSKEKLNKLTTYISNKRQVFVVMKLGDETLDSAYEGVIQPTLEKFKYSVVRIDKVQDSGRITEQILSQIARSEIVLADLTGERPNCYYEAGYAHALGKEIILTVKKGGKVHFDLASNRFILWGTEEELRKELTRRLEAIQQRAKQTR